MIADLADRVRRRAARLVRVKTAPSGATGPMASITFDDFPRSAWTTAGPILAQYGAAATYYLSGTFCGRTADGLDYYTRGDLAEVRDAGHELACHTFSHLNAAKTRRAEMDADLVRNSDFIVDCGGAAPRNFAYPYGDISIGAKKALAPHFRSCRGIVPGPNAGDLELGCLEAVGIEVREWTPAKIEEAAAAAAERKGWLVLFSHDVSDDPSPYGCTPAMLRHALETLKRHGLTSITVDAALGQAGIAA